MTPKAIIFDCDGVVVDSEPAAFDLLAQDLADHGLPLSHDDIARLFIGGTVRNLHDQARAMGANFPDSWPDDFYARLYPILANGVPLVSGILPLLDTLDAKGIPYAIGSNGSQQKMQITLGQHNLINRFKGHLYSGQDMDAPKPAPDLYLHAARALGHPPSACVVIEDSPTGARAARAAGIRCLGYAPLGNTALAAEGAELFSNMAEVPGLLGL